MKLLRRIGIAAFALGIGLTVGCNQEVKIGAIISETGATGAYGLQVKKGMELAVAEVNEAGSVGTLTILYRDDQTSPAAGVELASKLIKEDQVAAIIGAISSQVTLDIAPLTEAAGIVLFSPSASAPSISDAGMRVFRNYPSDILEGTSMAEFARDLGLESVAILAVDNVYGDGLTKVFTEKFESKYRKIVASLNFAENESSQIKEKVAEIKALKPDGIYIVSYSKEMKEILTDIKMAGIQSVLLGSGSITPDIAAGAGEAADKLIFPQPNSWDAESNDPAVVNFVDAYRKKYNEEPDIYAAHGYDAVKILAEAIVRGGTAHPNNIYMGMSGTKDYRGAAGLTVFDSNGDVVRYPRLFIVDGANIVPYDKFAEEGGSIFKRN